MPTVLPSETFPCLVAAGPFGRQNLDRDSALKPVIHGLINFAHTARAEFPLDDVVAQSRPGSQTRYAGRSIVFKNLSSVAIVRHRPPAISVCERRTMISLVVGGALS